MRRDGEKDRGEEERIEKRADHPTNKKKYEKSSVPASEMRLLMCNSVSRWIDGKEEFLSRGE